MARKSFDSLINSSDRIPRLRHHKPSGRAVVTLNARDFYCGPWGTVAAKVEYDRLIRVWLANDRRIDQVSDVRISELVDRYLDHAEGYYRSGPGTGELEPLRRALIPLGEEFGRDHVDEFGPLKLKALRQRWIDEGRVRQQINFMVKRVVRCFKWGVENELVRGDVVHALRSIAGLRAGKSEAKESTPIGPADDALVDAALPFMAPPVRAMVDLQRHSGMRPGEVVQMTPATIDRTAAVWVYKPPQHKTQHHNRQRLVFLGPKCQAVLLPFLIGRDPDARLFSPAEAMEAVRLQRAANRKTPPGQGNEAGTNRRRRPRWSPSSTYTATSYGSAIAQACARAFPLPAELRPKRKEKATAWRTRIGADGVADAEAWRRSHHWHPNQLRHSFGTRARKAYGLEAAQVLLGHANANVTQIYAERDAEKAEAVAALIG